MAYVSIKKLTKIYQNGYHALNNVSLDVEAGKFLVILGPSGSGKSTLLRIIVGLEKATSGEIFIDEKNISTVAHRNREVAMVFQNYALFPHMNVYDNFRINH